MSWPSTPGHLRAGAVDKPLPGPDGGLLDVLRVEDLLGAHLHGIHHRSLVEDDDFIAFEGRLGHGHHERGDRAQPDPDLAPLLGGEAVEFGPHFVGARPEGEEERLAPGRR